MNPLTTPEHSVFPRLRLRQPRYASVRNRPGSARPLILTLGLILALSVSCSGGEEGARDKSLESQVVLEVGGERITLEQLNQYLVPRIGEFADYHELDSIKSRLMEDFVEELLLEKEARRLNVEPDEAEVLHYLQFLEAERPREPAEGSRQSLRADVVRKLRIQQYIRQHLVGDFAPDASDIQKYYGENADDFRVSDQVHVKEILVNSADQAERILELLKAAQYKNFSDLARLYSIAPTRANGGDMGTFARGDLPEEMEKVFFNRLVPGRVSSIIQTKYGYHIFQLMERVPAHRQSLEEVRGSIATILAERQEKRVLADKLNELRRKNPVTLYRAQLDFSYNGQQFLMGGSK